MNGPYKTATSNCRYKSEVDGMYYNGVMCSPDIGHWLAENPEWKAMLARMKEELLKDIRLELVRLLSLKR